MRSLLGWLETRLAQTTLIYLEIAFSVSIVQANLSHVAVI